MRKAKETPEGDSIWASGPASVAIGGNANAPVYSTFFAGGLNLYVGRRPYDVVELAAPEVAIPSYLREQPSRLLSAAHRIVDFQGRVEEIKELTAWRDASGTFNVFLVHGTAGQGKSRLAMRFAELSAAAGWLGFGGHLGAAAADIDQLPSGQQGRLVVVDYADRWPAELLSTLFRDTRLHDAPTRVLILARPAGAWWEGISRELTDRFRVPPGCLRLGPLPIGTGDREKLFVSARDRFAVLLGVPGVHDLHPPKGWASGASALDIHMAALAAVFAAARKDLAPDDPGALSRYLLEREREHWTKVHRTAQRSTTPETMGKAVYLACLTGPVRHDQASGLLTATGVTAPGAETNHAIEDHRFCYPAWSSQMIFLPLRPDRMSEDYIALFSTDALSRSFEPDPWAAGKVPALLKALVMFAPERVSTMLITATAVAQRSSLFARDHLGPLLRDHPDLVLSAGSPLLSAIADLQSLDTAAIAAVESRLPVDGPRETMAPAAVLTGRLYDMQRSAAPYDDATAGLGLRLARRLLRAGRPADAVTPIEAAVRWWRRPRLRRSASEKVTLAIALSCLAETYDRTGYTTQALGIVDGSADLLRAAGVASDEADAALAEALTVRARLNHGLRRYRDAAEDVDEAAVIWEILTEGNPGALVKLARSLSTLARYRAAAGQGRPAYEAAEGAIRVWRQLVTADRGDVQLELIDVLVLLAGCTAAPLLRRQEVAAEASESLWRLWRRDITQLPRAVDALVTRADVQSQAGDYKGSLESARLARSVVVHLDEHYRALVIRCDLRYARSCLDSRQELLEGLRAAKRAAYDARNGLDRQRLPEIEGLIAGLRQALGRQPEADRILGF